MKIYISGAITNNPDYEQQFEAAEKAFEAEGLTPVNPAKNNGYDYKSYIDIGLIELMNCEAIYMLPGWQKSTGARLELQYAKAVGLEVIYSQAQQEEYCDICGKPIKRTYVKLNDGIYCPSCVAANGYVKANKEDLEDF